MQLDPRFIISIGLFLNILGAIIIAFFVRHIQRANGNALGHPKEKYRYYLGWILIILGFILQIVGLWL